MEFAWDETKRESVIGKHKFDFAKIQDIFDDPFAFYYDDYEHSGEEEEKTRRAVVGKTVSYGLIVLFYVFEEETIRFITARRAEKWMVNEYERQEKRFDDEFDLSEEEFKKRFKRVERPKFLDKVKGKSLRDCKSRITIMIDADIIEHFKKLAEETGKGYQTLINETLRISVDLEKTIISEVKDEFLNDKRFLEDLKTALTM